eukprot:SAG31_NODE_26925_length_434_cov_0.704478_1_plen_99_part_00
MPFDGHRCVHSAGDGACAIEFGEACEGEMGISGVTAALNMPGGGIHFAEGCGEIAWTGDILADNTFVSDSSSRHVQYAVRSAMYLWIRTCMAKQNPKS